MKPSHLLLPVLSLALTLACGGPSLMPNRVVGGRASSGMSEAQLIERLGAPLESVTYGRVKYLSFPTLEAQGTLVRFSKDNPTWVRLVDGTFDTYVRRPDPAFVPQTPPPVAAPEPAPRAVPPQPAAPAYDLRGELERLNKMKADGLITEDEYKTLRAHVLEKAMK
nr:SHOCT domain-containing protein [uncultured Holophaga sp.]